MKQVLKRKIDTFLTQWKQNPQRLPLIVKGSRQVGKTFSIEQFAKSYGNFIKIKNDNYPKHFTWWKTIFF